MTTRVAKKKNITIYNNKHLPNIPFTMARDEVDISLITNDRRKRKLPAYATDADNISADKNDVVKRMKVTSNPTQDEGEESNFPFIDKLLN